MNTISKMTDAVVIAGSGIISISAVGSIINSVKSKNGMGIAIGGLTLLIGIYAFRSAVNKIND